MCEEKSNPTTINMFIEYASRKAFHIPLYNTDGTPCIWVGT